MAYNTYWYDDAYAQPGYDAYVTYDDEVYVLAPDIEVVEKNRILFPLILQTINGPVSSHMTFIFQKPFQFLMGFGFYF